MILMSCEEQHRPIYSNEVASNGISSGAISTNGKFSVVGSMIHGGSLWRNTDNERLYDWKHSPDSNDHIILSASIDTTNVRALTTGISILVLWDIDTGQALRFWRSPTEILDSQLNTSGRYAILGLADHTAVIFDVVRGGIVRTFRHKGRVHTVDINTKNQLAVTGSEDQTATIWNIRDGKSLFTIQHEEEVQLVTFSPDGHYVITAAQYDRAELWDTKQQKKRGIIPLKKQQLKLGLRITSARFSKNGRYFLLGYANRNIELRSTQSLALLEKWTLPKRKQWQPTAAAVIDVAFDEQDKYYWAMSSDGFVHFLENAH